MKLRGFETTITFLLSSGLAAIAAMSTSCVPSAPASQGPDCHYVICGDLIDGFDEPRCGVFVNHRFVSIHATGQEAFDFIRRNNLRTCDLREEPR